MQTQAQKELYTYEDAATELDKSPFTIRKAVSAGILHPIKLPHNNRKFIHIDEIEWYRNRELSLPNAELFHQHKEQQESEITKSWPDIIIEAINSIDPFTFLVRHIFTVALTAKNTLEKEIAFKTLLSLIMEIPKTKAGQAIRKKLAATLVETFSDTQSIVGELPPNDRKLLDIALDGLLKIGTEELIEPGANAWLHEHFSEEQESISLSA